MNREQREQLTREASQKLATYHTLKNPEEAIYSYLLNTYGLEMLGAGSRDTEEWISRILAALPTPIYIERLKKQISVGDDLLSYHWKALDREGDEFIFEHCLEKALTYVMQHHDQEQSGKV